MGILDEMLEGKKTIVILGHVNPDGDCIGSCLGLYNYLKENYEGLEVSVYLEMIKPAYGQPINKKVYDTTIGFFDNLLHQSLHRYSISHHTQAAL